MVTTIVIKKGEIMKKLKTALILLCVLLFINSCRDKESKQERALASIDLLRGELLLCGDGQFGELKFSLSCNYETRPTFDLGMALLHSFQYTEAEKAFVKVIDADPNCPMAYWGVAMSIYHAAWFPPKEKELIKGSSDFFGLNHYTTMYAAHDDGTATGQHVYGKGGISEDQDVDLSLDPDWKVTLMQWAVVPWGCKKLLEWIDERYDSPEIYITENGCAYPDELIDGVVNDQNRLEFYRSYLVACNEAIENGIKLKGYFAWSFMDNFEWASGYDKRFGLHYVDFKTLERTPKNSALWFAKVTENNSVDF